MLSFNRKNICLLIILMITLGFVLKIEYFKPEKISKIDFSKIPLKLNEWTGSELESEDYVYEILETKDLLTRRYVDGKGNSLFLTIICSDQNNGAFHPPEVCYSGGDDNKFLENVKDQLLLSDKLSVNANKLFIKTSFGYTKLWYWFMIGGDTFGDFYKSQIKLLFNLLTGGSSQAAMIKITINSKNDPDDKIAQNFATLIYPHLKELL